MNSNNQLAEYCDIILTDIQMHVAEPRKPISWHRAVSKSLRSGKSGRFYTKNIMLKKDGKSEVIFDLPPETQKKIEEAKKSGKKIRFVIPEGGIPIFPGKDLTEKMEADKRKLLKKVDKNLDKRNFSR